MTFVRVLIGRFKALSSSLDFDCLIFLHRFQEGLGWDDLARNSLRVLKI